MPNGAAALPSPLKRQRRWAAELRASQRQLPTVPQAISEEEESEEEPAFREEDFGKKIFSGTEIDEVNLARFKLEYARYQEEEQKRARQGAALATEEEARARELGTGWREARKGARTDGAAEKAKAEASERARKELVARTTKYLLQGAKAGTGVTVVGLLIAFAIMNLQLVAINIYNRGKPMEIGGFQIPPLAMWEVVLVLVLDFLCIVLNPFTLFIIFFVTLFGGGLSI